MALTTRLTPASDSEEAEIDAAAFRWMRPLAIAAIAVVVTAAVNSKPAPGLRGAHLGVTCSLVVFVVGTVAIVRLPMAGPRVLVPLLAAALLGAAALVGFQPDGPGFLGVFPAVSAAALRLPRRSASPIVALAVAGLGAAWAIGGGHHPVTGIVLNEFGVVAFFMLALFARRYREANDRANALIMELNESRGAQAEAAALAERQRLAREMHDVLAHSLAGLLINLEGARLLADRGEAEPEVAEAIGRAQRLARTGLDEARRAIGMLRGDALPGPERLVHLVETFEADTGIPCTLTVEGDERDLDPDARLTVYRVAQEALTNIRKHSDPAIVDVCFSYQTSGTELSVADHHNGDVAPTVTAGASAEGGYGLTGMRERAELLGGRVTAGATCDGFEVRLWMPR